MIEYTRHIEEYVNYFYASFSQDVPESEWGNKKLAEKYLKKYWLEEKEYLDIWQPIQDKVFIKGREYLDVLYTDEFKIIALRGGCLFVEEEFKKLQKALLNIEEKFFVVIQHSQEYTSGEPVFRMKYPTNISWDELMSGNYISSVIFEMYYNEYFVFGESGRWGKYCANDALHPLDIIGCKPELLELFENQFKLPEEEVLDLVDWIPEAYKDIITLNGKKMDEYPPSTVDRSVPPYTVNKRKPSYRKRIKQTGISVIQFFISLMKSLFG